MASNDRLSGPARLALLAPAVLVIGLCLAGPLALLLSYSFAPGGSTQADFSDGLTIENYVSILGDVFYLAIILKTLWLSVIITLAAVLVGWPLAYFLWRAPPRFKTLLTVVVVAPLLISIPVRNYGWMVILGDSGLFDRENGQLPRYFGDPQDALAEERCGVAAATAIGFARKGLSGGAGLGMNLHVGQASIDEALWHIGVVGESPDGSRSRVSVLESKVMTLGGY